MLIMLGRQAVQEIGKLVLECNEHFFDGVELSLPAGLNYDQDFLVSDIFDQMTPKKVRCGFSISQDWSSAIVVYNSQEACEWLAPRLIEKGCACCLNRPNGAEY